VINTCCHFDHIGNNTKFPNARFIVQKLELPLGIHPLPWALYYSPPVAAADVVDIVDYTALAA
jgi:glyoxylase-like metal-dependent hydrolase (beta-lactamase superfamily II)